MATKLRAFQKREKQLKAILTGAENFVKCYNADSDAKKVELRLKALDGVLEEFYQLRNSIELLQEEIAEKAEKKGESTDVCEIDENEQHDFENHYFDVKAELLSLLPAVNAYIGADNSVAQHGDQSHKVSRVKLPEICLPKFNGNIRDWVTFRDTFKSLIHNSNELTDMDKFTYLRSALSAGALQEINSVQLSAANYLVAWTVLEKRYENKKLIVKAHLDALFALEPVKKESYDGLNHLLSEVDKNLQMLDKIGENTGQWSTILVHMMCSRLDSATLRHWEAHHNSKEVPQYSDLVEFLSNHCAVLQSVAPAKVIGSEQRITRQTVCHATTNLLSRCPFCSEQFHSAFQCGKFQRMKQPERLELVNRNDLCRNCLRSGHFSRTCESGTCRHCSQKHHTMLHPEYFRSSVPRSSILPPTRMRPQPQPQSKYAYKPNQQTHTTYTAKTQSTHSRTAPDQPSTSQTCVAFPATPTQNILLSTALIKLKDSFGNTTLARALLDSCSQHCLMTDTFARKLQFLETPTYLMVQGIGTSQSVATRLVTAIVEPRSTEISTYAEEMQFFVLPQLTIPLPTTTVDLSDWDLLESTLLADPQFYKPDYIDVIIGAEYYLDLLKAERRKATCNGPTLQNSVLGWIVSGRIPNNAVESHYSHTYVCSTADIQNQLTKFWELETCRTNCTHSIEESACEEHFAKTTIRDKSGSYIVTLPKKMNLIHRIGESKRIAVKRLLGMERRFATNPVLKEQYTAFIDEYVSLGHMKEVVNDNATNPVYYMPHHAVLKPSSTTTKLRVVFDASCSTSTGVSLNDALMVGPVVQDELLSIVLRFRLRQFALVADIAKMYRMVRMNDADQCLQRILWRRSPEDEIRTYELTTITYGTASAPYLATKCLQQLAKEGESTHPIAAKVLKKDFYVDDMLSGAETIEEAKAVIGQTIHLLQTAGFTLRKWNSNSRKLLQEVPESLRDDRMLLELDSSSSTVSTLGLMWEPGTDNFRFNSPPWNSATTITKRVVLSDVSRLFDPLGLVGPVIVQAKIFIQRLWMLECSWDEPLSIPLQEQWHEYRRNLAGLEGLTVPRWVNRNSAVEIHGFCDASDAAYGACIYLKTIREDGSAVIRLLTAKSRVASLENVKKGKKKMTTPRLELSSALLLSHLYEKLIESIGLTDKVYFWTDSMIVKCWLSSSPSRWKQFVANRVSEIQHITKMGEWNHVAGADNPADIISRGMTPAQLKYQTLWFSGPHWLLREEAQWPKTQEANEKELEQELLEEKSVTAVVQTISPSEVFSWRASLSDLIRLVAYINRFRFNAQAINKANRKSGALTYRDLDDALKCVVRIAQRESFAQEIEDLAKGRQIKPSSKILSLNPQLIDGIVCVGGRLQNANIAASRKHPYVLDHRHPLTTIIVEEYHRKYYHAGHQLLVSLVRGRFWPTSARNVARQVIHRCVPCFRTNPKTQEQLMADLPSERVTPCFPFLRVGVDYCGPFLISYPNRRCQPIKSFVAVFVCLVTKAVHLELVADLTTQAFLAALKRFISQRGKPDLIMCDNAKNFVGAKRELDELRKQFLNQQFQAVIAKATAADAIEFRFIPARSPNFGGLWESAVKSFKTLFKRTIGTKILVYDEMRTVIAEVQAILNSRPLTPLSNDPNDFEALTPAHFLVQRPLAAVPEPDLEGIPENRLSMWQRAQRHIQILWKRWSISYLSDLNNRTKWMKKKNNVTVGTMVVLKEDNLAPLKWQLGRVSEIHAGSDGNVRVVTVRTKDGSYKRGISKVCVLPIPDNDVCFGEN